jgi:3-oxoacyl-[acyl-carrier protein] reductase
MFNFENKVALITGAGSGIGQSQAKTFLDNGAKVALVDIDLSNVDKFVEENEFSRDNMLEVQTDITDENEVTEMVEKVIDTFGRIDFLCNTAGAFDELTPTLETDIELWNKVTQVNVTGMFLVTKAVLPHMVEANDGKIINIASAAGLTGGGGGIAYTTSKHAVIGLTRQVAVEHKHDGIQVNSIAPGLIDTQMVEELMKDDDFRTQIEQGSSRLGEVEDISKATLFLASDLSDYVNGEVLSVDGGLSNSL